MDGTRLWLVGQVRIECDAGSIWEFQGVFTTEAEAAAACRTPMYFVAPVVVGEQLPDETVAMSGCYFPLAGTP